MAAVTEEAREALVKEAGDTNIGTHREQTARMRVRGLAVLQLIARGYSLAYIANLRAEPLAELVISLRDTLDALGAETVREGVREAQRRQLII